MDMYPSGMTCTSLVGLEKMMIKNSGEKGARDRLLMWFNWTGLPRNPKPPVLGHESRSLPLRIYSIVNRTSICIDFGIRFGHC